jgi:two-component system chemotaxis sensor kinase CheA
MSKIDELKNTFFDECSELLQDIETGLTDMREGRGTEDTVHAVFRAAHSVKGGAGIFGFERLVGFAHVFETVLDDVRHEKLATSDDVMSVLLQAGDVLADLVGMARSGEEVPPGFEEECRQSLDKLAGTEEGGGDSGDFGDISFVPVAAGDDDFTPIAADGLDDIGDLGAAPGERTFRISFKPSGDLLKKANEPLYILRELAKLGRLELTADTSALPRLDKIQPDNAYVSWQGVLHTMQGRAEIDSVFEFVLADCELEIVEDLPAAAEMPMAPAAEADEPVEAEPALQMNMPVPVAASSPPLAPEKPSEIPDMKEAGKPAAAKSTAGMTTRVDLEKIDRVVNMVGELVIAQAMLGQVVRDLPEDVAGRISQSLEEVIHHTRELKDSVMSMRAQPVKTVFQRMPRLVRELSTKTGKNVRLEMLGENTEIDKTIIERLSDPLTHVIRNSVDHGIELPADRIAAGKSETGTIRLSASHRGGRIVIEVKDDGAGINNERVLKKARERGLIEANATLSDDEISNLIFMPGFSTAETISDISGRGVGMDVVRRNIQDIGGRISLKSDPGRGLVMQLSLPLTLAVMDGMVVEVGRDNYVIPISAIVECLRPSASDIRSVLGTLGTLQLRGAIVPLLRLSDLFGIASARNDVADSVVIIVEASEGARLGVVVDELRGHQQVVIKSIEDNYGIVPGIAGATILGNGRVAFIIDVDRLASLAGDGRDSPAPRAEPKMVAA